MLNLLATKLYDNLIDLFELPIQSINIPEKGKRKTKF